MKPPYDATTLIRAGILAAYRLNLHGIASKAQWAYYPKNQFHQQGRAAQDWYNLKTVHRTLESTLQALGSQPDALRWAILTGKANPGKAFVTNLNPAHFPATSLTQSHSLS